MGWAGGETVGGPGGGRDPGLPHLRPLCPLQVRQSSVISIQYSVQHYITQHYSETTDGKQFDVLLDKVAGRGRTLFRLFQHPSMTIVKGAGLVMKAIIEEGEDEVNIDKLFDRFDHHGCDHFRLAPGCKSLPWQRGPCPSTSCLLCTPSRLTEDSSQIGQ